MASYLYRTDLYTDTSKVTGINISTNNANLSEYQSDHQSQTEKISDLTIAETTFVTEISWAVFHGAIVSPLTWADVKEAILSNRLTLYLITDNPL